MRWICAGGRKFLGFRTCGVHQRAMEVLDPESVMSVTMVWRLGTCTETNGRAIFCSMAGHPKASRDLTKGEETRRMILDRAIALTSTVGLEGLSIASVAREAGLSKSGLFAHFDSKEDLQVQVLRAAAERFVERVIVPALREPRGEPRIRAAFERWMGWEDGMPGGCVFIAAASELDDCPGAPRDALVAFQNDWLDSMAQSARIAVREGHFRHDLDCQQFAYDLYSVILAYQHFHRLLRDPGAADRARRSFEALLAQSRPSPE